jgi:hypothetical protein
MPLAVTPVRPARTFATAAAALCLAAPPASALQRTDSAALIVRLGHDTVAVERYVRTPARIDAVSVSRSPRTVVRHWSATLGPDGAVTGFAVAGAGEALEMRAPARAGAIPIAGGFYAPWSLVLQRAHAAAGTATEVDIQVGGTVRAMPVRREAGGRFALTTQFDQPMYATLDEAGRLRRIEIDGGTTVERVAWFDIDALAREFAARDERGAGLGPLSPRESVEATVHGARIAIAYGRPALRARPLGMLAPEGAVWRTGANEETTLTTDRPLAFDGITVPPGTYSLFTIPAAAGWTLIINRQTGQGGLAHDPAHDLGRVRMSTRHDAAATERFTIEIRPTGDGGALVLRWGGTEAQAAFRVGG